MSTSSRVAWIVAGLGAVATVYLVVEHGTHLYSVLPFLFALACPLMHLFHSHGDHKGNEKDRENGGSSHKH